MPRPIRPWFRFYTEACGDRKLRRLKPDYRWLFVACLAAARVSPEPGVLLVSEGDPMTVEDIADWAGMDVRTTRFGMRALVTADLFREDSDNAQHTLAYRSPTFHDRQYESDDVTKRTRKYRATREDTDEGTFQRSSQERSGNVGRNVPETDTETDTEHSPTESVPRKRGSRLDPTWIPPVDVRDQMATECPNVDQATEYRKFCDYWIAQPGQKGVKLDWTATYRNWIRRASENTATNGKSRRQQETDDLFGRAMQRAIERDRQQEAS